MKKGYTATKRKASENRTSSPSGFTELIVDKLEQLAREGAERMLAEMLEMEVSEFLQRVRYQRNPTFRGHRNGYAPERTVGVGLGALKMQMPRVSHVPREVAADGFSGLDAEARGPLLSEYGSFHKTIHQDSRLAVDGIRPTIQSARKDQWIVGRYSIELFQLRLLAEVVREARGQEYGLPGLGRLDALEYVLEGHIEVRPRLRSYLPLGGQILC